MLAGEILLKRWNTTIEIALTYKLSLQQLSDFEIGFWEREAE